MIRVDGLIKTFGRFKAVDNLSLRVPPGQALALWGSNGAGKTTVIRCVLGLLAYSGNITIDGQDIKTAGKSVRNLIGYVPQELAFHDDLGLLETLHFFAKLRRVANDRPYAVLDEVGLAGHGDKRIRQLSGGMKQRMALALALLSDPPVLILDELTSNLDTTAQLGFMSLLRQQRAKGKTILFTSHRLEEVESLADRVIVLNAGKRELECQPHDLAPALGLRCILQMFLADDCLDDAVAALRQRGFQASRNGLSLWVQVPANEKAVPFRVLEQADITVRTFQFASENSIEPGALS